MFALRVVDRTLGLVRIIVLARLLTPEAFGLVGIALLVIELLRTFTQVGFTSALIQRRGDIREYLDTAWVMSVVRGLVLGGLVFGSAPLAAGFFNAPDSRSIIQAMGAVLVIRGFVNSGTSYFYKELEVHKRFVWDTSSTITEMVVSIAAALILRNAWALVYGAIASSLISMVLSYVMHPYRPRFRFDLKRAKDLFSFGGWVLLGTSFDYIFTNVDTIFVGRILGVVSLGIFGMAHRIGDLIGREMGILSDNVAFPAYSKLQDNLAKLNQAFSTSIGTIAIVTFPIATGIFVLAPDFVTNVLGNQWIQAITAMQILGIAAAIYSLMSVGGSLFYGVGKPRFRFLMIGVASFVMIILLLPLTRGLGLAGAALAVLAGNFVGLFFLIWASVKILNTGVKDLIRPFISPVIISFILGFTLVLTKHVVGQVGLGEFIFILCVGVTVYVAFTLILWRFFRSGPVQFLTALRAKK